MNMGNQLLKMGTLGRLFLSSRIGGRIVTAAFILAFLVGALSAETP